MSYETALIPNIANRLGMIGQDDGVSGIGDCVMHAREELERD